MAEILLCNQPIQLTQLANQHGISTDSVSGFSCENPNISKFKQKV